MSIDLQYRTATAPYSAVPVRGSSLHHGKFARFIADNNPCYLLSAACMLLGLMTLTNSLSFSPIPHHRLLALIGTLNLYETVLIALAIWLIGQRRIIRDGEILLAIEALFIADGAMLSAEMFTADLFIGLVVNLMLLALTAGKLWFVAATLKLPVARTLLPLVGLQTLVLGLPGMCKWTAEAHGGRLPPLVLYAAWWTTAATPILVMLVGRAAATTVAGGSPQPFGKDRAVQVPRRIALTFAVMMGVSIIVHLSMASWVYNVHWYPADLAPLALGAAVASAMAARRTCLHGHINPTVVRAQIMLPCVAIILSLASPRPLMFGDVVTITTLRCALLGAAIVLAIAFLRLRLTRFAVLSLVSLFFAVMGATVDAMIRHVTWPGRMIVDNSSKMVPASSFGWGVLAVSSAFFLLIAGAFISIWKKPPPEADLAEVFSVALRDSDAPPGN